MVTKAKKTALRCIVLSLCALSLAGCASSTELKRSPCACWGDSSAAVETS